MNLMTAANDELVWGISEAAMEGMRARALGADPGAAMTAYFSSLDDPAPEKPYKVENGVAIIPVTGPLMKGFSFWCYWYGGTSMERLQGVLEMAGEDADVEKVKLVFDTPGGTLSGSFDLCKAIRNLKAKKPVEGYISDQCCSLGYLLAAQCDPLVANAPTAMIGNIGTLLAVDDLTKLFAMQGVERRLYKSTPLKGAGTPGTPISKAQDAEFQALVDVSNAEFVAAIAAGRGVPVATVEAWATAHVYLGREALAAGLIDKIDGEDAEPVAVETDSSEDGDNDGDSDDLGARQASAQPDLALMATLDGPAFANALLQSATGRTRPDASAGLAALNNNQARTGPVAVPRDAPRATGAGPAPASSLPAQRETASGREGKPMKEKFVRLLSALGFKNMAVAVVSATDESVESLLQTVSEQVHVEVEARIRNHPLMLACDAAGITSAEQLGQVLDMKALGEKYIRDLRDDAKGEAIRAYGADAGSRIGATVEKLSFHEVKALRDGWQTEADRKFEITQNGAERASAPKAAAVNADPPADPKPKSAWEQLTEDQRRYATTAGYAKTAETKETFAREYLKASGKELSAA